MDLDQLSQILKLVREHQFAEFEIEHDGLRLKVRRDAASPVIAAPADLPAVVAPASAPSAVPMTPAAIQAAAAAASAAAEDEIELAVVKSPIVGTFYRSPEPGAPPFVDVGSIIKKGQVLCVIEAMKLMNEIDAECDGEVMNVYVENGQPVQYGERLFAIKTK
jgi:acetyl-CoA carboxylase biotin carboxyl carrier protein